jgi:hypothetical protein
VHILTETSMTPNIDFCRIKQRHQIMWTNGDCAVVGTTMQIVGENLPKAADVCAGQAMDKHIGDASTTNNFLAVHPTRRRVDAAYSRRLAGREKRVISRGRGQPQRDTYSSTTSRP